MILRRYHESPDPDPEEQAVVEQPPTAPQAPKPAGRSAAPGKAKKTDGG